MTKPKRSMKLAEFINIHNYFMRLQPPLSETSKEVLREIEEHILSIIQKERYPIQTQPETKTEPFHPNLTHFKDII